MLSVSSIRSKSYYIKLSSEDYYLDGGEPSGQWHGKGAAALNLKGEINPQHFGFVIDGYGPDGVRKLVQNAGDKKRQPGWDLTFSAPKTVSTVWSQADEKTRHKIQNAQEQAARKALDWLESVSITRRGKGGHQKEQAKLVIAMFEHGTSRAQDPQLHTHCLVMNTAVRQDGSTGAIESQQFYINKMTAGALYRAEFAHQLEQQCGLEIIQTGQNSNLFEIKGVDKALTNEFSKRREEIENALKDSGREGAKSAEIAALDTRHVKGHLARAELFRQWQDVGKAFNYQPPKQVKNRLRDPKKLSVQLQRDVLDKLLYHNSTFTERDLIRKLAEAAPTTGLGAEKIQQLATETLNHQNIVCLGRQRNHCSNATRENEPRFTTKEMLALETQMLERVKRSQNNHRHQVRSQLVRKVCDSVPTLKAEQRAAINHIVAKKGSVQVVEGWAGTGKTFMLNTAREAWERSGYRVQGAALAAKAASGLQEAGIQSQTLHRLLYQLNDGKVQLTGKDVVVVDETGMVGTRQIAALIEHTERADAKLILVGDSRQLQPIEAGGAFRTIGEEIGRAELQQITRQTAQWMRRAVRDIIAGNAEDVLRAYAQRQQLTVQEDMRSAREALVEHWAKAGGLDQPQDNIILASSNVDVFDMNKQAQAARGKAGLLGSKPLEIDGNQFLKNDRILFTRNSYRDGVKNGQVGTITAINGHAMKVRLDTGEERRIDAKHYQHVKLGYAVTTHKAQGVTRKQSFVLLGGSIQDRELSYVQLSRSKGKTYLFTDRQEAGDALLKLSKKMARSRQKELAVAQL